MKRLLFALLLLATKLPAAELTHGPILGRPGEDTMRVWIRTDVPADFRVICSRDPKLKEGINFAIGRTTADQDLTGYVDLTGLTPAKTYHYAIEVEGERVSIGEKPPTFKTWPSKTSFAHLELNPEGRANRTVGIGVCNHHTGARKSQVYANLFERHRQDLDLFIMNGDYIYDRARKKIPPSEIGFDIIRQDYKEHLELIPDMARFFTSTPILFQFDDHEIGPEQSTAEVGLAMTDRLRRSYTNPVLRDIGLKAWYEYCGWANFPMPNHQPIHFGTGTIEAGSDRLIDPSARFSAMRPEATSTLHVHLPHENASVYAVEEVIDDHTLRVRPPFAHDEADASYSVGTRHFHDFRMENAHFFVLDTRGERSSYRFEDRDKPRQQVLGPVQTQWLLDGVQASDAEFIVIVSPVPWTVYHNASHVEKRVVRPEESEKEDGMIGALTEREPLLEAFDALKKPVVIVSGDLHSGYGVEITENVWEFVISPIASSLHPIESGGNPPFGGRFDSAGREVKIKWASAFPLAVTKEFEAQKRRHGFVYGLLKFHNVFPTGIDEKGQTLWKAYDTPRLAVEVRDTETDEIVYAETISPLDAE